MTVVDYIDLDDDDCYVKVHFVDLSTDEDSVEKDGNVPENVNVARSENVAKAAVSLSISEQDGTTTTSLSKLEHEHAATASLSMVEHGATTSSIMAEETMQPEHQKFFATSDVAKEATRSGNHGLIATGDLVGEARQSEHEAEASVFSSRTEQGASTSLLLINQVAITSSFKEDTAILSGNQVFVTEVDCAKEVTQSENIAKADGLSSITESGAMGVKGYTGNSMSSKRTYNHAQEEPEGDNEKNENCDFEAELAAFFPEVSQNDLAMSLPPRDKEKEISQCRKVYGRKGKKQVNTSARECNRQLSIVHSKGVLPTLHNGDSGFSVVGNVHDGTSSTGIYVLDGEVVASTYQGCNTTSKGNVMDVKVRDSGSKGCMVEDTHGGTPLCVFHNSWPHKRCCTVIGCTTAACTSIRGRTGCCTKHGGGKRCKHDGCGKGAIGKTDNCIAHGGGRRCKFQGCRKSAQGRTDYCVEHGGGRRCKFQGCRKSAIWRSDYCVKHGSGRRCKFLGCSSSATCGKDFCSIHRTSMLSGDNSAHVPTPAPAGWAKKAARSEGRNSCSVIGESAQKRQNTNDSVNTRSFNFVETAEEKGRVLSEQYAESTANNQQQGHRIEVLMAEVYT